MKPFSRSLAWLPLSMALLVSACGGGGGGSSAGSDVNIQLNSPAAINVSVSEGWVMPDTTVTGTATGNLQSLSGKTIYAVIVDANQLFQNNATVSIANNGQFTLSLHGNTLTKVGTFTGNLQLYACLDPACNSQLGHSPLALPYNVTVSSGLIVDTTPIHFTRRVGDPTQTSTLTVTLPQYLTSWGHSILGTWVTANSSSAWSGETATLTLTVPTAPAGTYSSKLTINATIRPPGASSDITLTKTIDLTHQVSAN